jgi:ABC-2 type transport system ATP-binding protein
MTAVIETHGLTKYYGDVEALVDLDLTVERGEIVGFLGPNGAGKSTTIRLLLDLIRPTRGSATVLGLDTRNDSLAIRRRVGYLPGELAMYDAMTGEEMLGFFAALRDLDGMRNARGLAERLDLDLARRVEAYSSGNRQKLGLVAALMHDPEVLVLDEPTNALDPLIQQEFYAVLDERRDAGTSVFLSSHVLPEVERVADRAAIIRRGRLVAVETVAEMKHLARRRISLQFAEPVDAAVFAGLEGVESVDGHGDGTHGIDLVVTGTVDAVVKTAARYEVTGLVAEDGDLEEAFLAYYGDGDAG